MPVQSQLSDPQTGAKLAALFRKPPVLVEVRFPRMGTAPDWLLVEEESDLGVITERLAPGAELHLNSVWDMKASTGELILRK